MAEIRRTLSVPRAEEEKPAESVEDLKARLDEALRELEEMKARPPVTAQAMGFSSPGQEVPAGETESGKPLFSYVIDLPPCGGVSIKRNGIDYYHGETYTFTLDELRSIKEMVHRAWQHEASTKGNDENFYRPKMNNRISMRGAA